MVVESKYGHNEIVFSKKKKGRAKSVAAKKHLEREVYLKISQEPGGGFNASIQKKGSQVRVFFRWMRHKRWKKKIGFKNSSHMLSRGRNR